MDKYTWHFVLLVVMIATPLVLGYFAVVHIRKIAGEIRRRREYERQRN